MSLEVFTCSWVDIYPCDGLCVCHEGCEFIICKHLVVKNVFKGE